MRRVLVVEADEDTRRRLLVGLRERGIDADAVDATTKIGPSLEAGVVDVIVLGPGAALELGAPFSGGVDPCEVAVVAQVAGGADLEDGLAAIRRGAVDAVPVSQGAQGVAAALRKIEARSAFAQSIGRLSGRLAPAARPRRDAGGAGETSPVAEDARGGPRATLVGGSPKIAAVLAMVRRLAAVDAAVLVIGESGTGKELIARQLHDLSPRHAGPFVAVNAAAIPGGLIESELFGHARGAFTDAVRDKRGLFEAAHGGTLFLDEIADLPIGLQAKLLRVLQDNIVRRVGDVEDRQVDVRVVAASGRDLLAEAEAGHFRADLYYRLAGFSVQLPPLRDRRDDIPALVEHFLSRACGRLGLPVRQVNPEAMRLLVSYAWPGNVRELENTVERAAVLCTDGRIDVASLPERIVAADSPAAAAAAALAPVDPDDLSIKRASRRTEEDLIRRALARTAGNRTKASELLEISHRALLYKIKEYEISVEKGRSGGKPPGTG